MYYYFRVILLPILFFSFMSVSPLVAKPSLFNITIGSSLNTSSKGSNSHWLSPSGKFAFGFYPLNSSNTVRYVIGIWITKSSTKTLVWLANCEDPPISDPSSILFSHYGTLVRITGKKEKFLLPDAPQTPASYAILLDSGNLVLYNSDAHIIWESFDHPTDTILPGQTLISGSRLVARSSLSDYSSGMYELRIENTGDIYVYDNMYHEYVLTIYSSRYTRQIMMKVNTNGSVSLVDLDGMVIKSLSMDNEYTQGSQVQYRATLDPNGYFHLYRDRFQDEKSWGLNFCESEHGMDLGVLIVVIVFGVIIGGAFLACVIFTIMGWW